jgi:hypothetical protein
MKKAGTEFPPFLFGMRLTCYFSTRAAGGAKSVLALLSKRAK